MPIIIYNYSINIIPKLIIFNYYIILIIIIKYYNEKLKHK